VLRVAARLGERAFAELSPLRYQGGFETKALVYETLVQLDEHGRIGPGLASSYRIEDAGRTLVFALRDGATWHDGSPVLAAEVAMHFRRWVGLPEHGWLRSNARVVSVRASGERELRLELDRPAAVLADLCAINPTAVAGPATWSREGDFVRPVGSGPFVWQGGVAGQRLRYRAHGGTAALDLVHVDGDPLAALGRGEVDAVVGSWLVAVDPARVRQLQRDERFTVVTGPGSSVWQLELGWDHGPLATWARRAAVAASLDRAELIEVAAHGLGDPVSGYAAPSIVDWPAGAPVPAPVPRPEFPAPLRLVAGAAEATLVAAVCRQLGAAGIPVETVASTASTWDLRLVRTHGVPYDPFTFVERYGRPARGATAASPQARGLDAELATAIDGFLAATDPATWPQHYARVQARFDALLPMVPLFAPRRVAVLRRGLPPLPRLVHDLYRLDADWLRDAAR
jgi:ABC-type transport system substrate-binding protein